MNLAGSCRARRRTILLPNGNPHLFSTAIWNLSILTSPLSGFLGSTYTAEYSPGGYIWPSFDFQSTRRYKFRACLQKTSKNGLWMVLSDSIVLSAPLLSPSPSCSISSSGHPRSGHSVGVIGDRYDFELTDLRGSFQCGSKSRINGMLNVLWYCKDLPSAPSTEKQRASHPSMCSIIQKIEPLS